ncbi:hypothetical protein ACQP2E_10230 [Actinoplanes sp. CA-015351]|uniref:hypothetical protein n=1 Tax=Actinoplanes sp. CA-015351 TaxID=3239897 RepID=UPI003D9848CE
MTADQMISVTGEYFDPPSTGETVDDTMAFEAGKVPRSVDAPRDCSALRQSLRAQGGYDSGLSYIQVEITAKAPVDIQVKTLRPRLLSERAPTHVVPISCIPKPGKEESPLPESAFIVLTDEPRPTDIPLDWLQRTPTSGGEFRLSRGGSIRLQPGEEAAIRITATQGHSDLDWELLVGLMVNGVRREIPVRHGGEPFHYAPSSAEAGFLWHEAHPGLGLAPDHLGFFTEPAN